MAGEALVLRTDGRGAARGGARHGQPGAGPWSDHQQQASVRGADEALYPAALPGEDKQGAAR